MYALDILNTLIKLIIIIIIIIVIEVKQLFIYKQTINIIKFQ